MKPAPPQVSFIIPAYNAARTLIVTARSLLSQTVAEWEAVIVDDGSSDRTARIAARLVRSDPRFRLVRQENAGPSAARNAGLAQATAPLVTFIDADDWIAPRFLASLIPLANPFDCLAFCAYQRILPSGRACPPDFCAQLQHDPLGVLAFRCEPAIHCVVAPRAAILAVGGFDPELHCCEDWDLWLRLARAGVRFVGTDRALAFYQMEQGSLSTRHNGGEQAAGIVAQRARECDTRLPPEAPFRKPLAIALHDMADEQALRADISRIARGDELHDAPETLARWEREAREDPDLIAMLFAEVAAATEASARELVERAVKVFGQFDSELACWIADAWAMACAKAEDGHFGRYLSITVDLRAVPAQIDLPCGVDTVLLRSSAEDGLPYLISLPVSGAVTGAQVVQALIHRSALAPLIRASRATRSPRFWSALSIRFLTISAAHPAALIRNSRAVMAQAIRAGLISALNQPPLTHTRPLLREIAVPVLMVPPITANDSALLAPTIGHDQIRSLIALLVAEGYRGVSLDEVMRIRETAATTMDRIFALAFEDRASALQCGLLQDLPEKVSSVDVLLSPGELDAEAARAPRPHCAGIRFGLKIDLLPMGTREGLAAARQWLETLQGLNGDERPVSAKCERPGIGGEILEQAGFAPIIYPGSTLRRLSSPGVVFPGIECTGAEALGTVVECLRAA